MNTPGEHLNTLDRVLADRARVVARAPLPEMTEDTIEVVVVALQAERYGLETARVSEIQHLGPVAPVPGLASLWVGLVNIRSQLVPLLDLRAALGLTPYATGDLDGQIVLVEAGGVRAGLLVDEVLKVERLPRTAIGSSLRSVHSSHRKLTAGLTPTLLTLLDLEALLTDPRLVADDQVM